MAGWWCGRRHAGKRDTLSPAPAAAPAPAPLLYRPPSGTLYTTNYGKLWHRNRRCSCLDLARQILQREECTLCAPLPDVLPMGGLADTPPDPAKLS